MAAEKATPDNVNGPDRPDGPAARRIKVGLYDWTNANPPDRGGRLSGAPT